MQILTKVRERREDVDLGVSLRVPLLTHTCMYRVQGR